MSWNKHEAVSYARSHVHQKSQVYVLEPLR